METPNVSPVSDKDSSTKEPVKNLASTSGLIAPTTESSSTNDRQSNPSEIRTDINANADNDDSEDDDPDSAEFFFESDHLALRGNSDYKAVLRTIAVLQTQRMQVSRSIDELVIAEKRAHDNPEQFVRQFQQAAIGGPPILPESVSSVAELPIVNFTKYGIKIPDFETDYDIAEYNDQSAGFAGATADSNSQIVRGRMFDQTKPETFNQLWTCEEQKRLEELLIEFPPEAVEMRRFKKIADALGNRTYKQVASRLQKFFKKLHSAGMPVPGRIPKSNRQYVTRANRLHKVALRSTTFFPANQVPFHLADDEDDAAMAQLDSNWYRHGCDSGHSATTAGMAGVNASRTYVVDGGGPDEADASEQTLVLRLAMRIKKDKDRELRLEPGGSVHVGFKCDRCAEEPIIGTRWHCQSCDVDSVDFCCDCLLTQLQSNPEQRHPLTHRFVGLRVSLIDGSMEDTPIPSAQSYRALDQQNQLPKRYATNDDDDENYSEAEQYRSGNEDGAMSTQIKTEATELGYGSDYRFNKLEYNYLDPNFLPK